MMKLLLSLVSLVAVVGNPTELEWAFLNACADGNADIVGKMIKAGLDVNVKTDDGETPLHLASIGGSFNVVQQLVDNGTDLCCPL